MRVLIACETSGRTRDEFRKRGHDAWSADLLPCDADPAYHIVCRHELEIFEIINRGWDLMIAHPDCTYLTCSGLHWNKRRPERAAKTEQAVEFFRRMLEEPGAARRVLENPRGCISTRIRKYDHSLRSGARASVAEVGKSNRQWPEQAHAIPGQMEAAIHNLSRNCRGHGGAMGEHFHLTVRSSGVIKKAQR